MVLLTLRKRENRFLHNFDGIGWPEAAFGESISI